MPTEVSHALASTSLSPTASSGKSKDAAAMQRVKNSTMYVSCACIRVGVCSTLVPVCVLVLTAACAFVRREHLATAYNVTMQTQQLVRRHVWLWARRNSVMWAFHTFWNAGPNLYE